MDIEKLAGTKLGNCEIENLLGRGGMGVVYKARQISLDRPVALKILPPHLSPDAAFVKRFKREARAVAKLSHSNIVQIYDIAEEQNLHFFSMEYVEGKTLDKILEEKGRLEHNEAVKIISQAALALEHAHRNNIIHRDIKPSNIILDNFGNVKVMDFGLARVADDRSKVTQSGTLIGTLGYMSPEQCRGQELDFRTDIYSLGVVLYEMLTGRTPFDAPNDVALINKIINEEPPDVTRLNPDAPTSLNTVVSRATAKDREVRYASISEFLEDIAKSRELTSSATVSEGREKPSIAVLPFVDMSSQRDQEYFCDGLAEELINGLTQIADLHVIARTSAFSFKGQNLDIREIGKRLNVQTVLEGSVRKAGNQIRVTAQLVNTARGHHLWSEKYDRELENIFAIQDDISEAIVGKLKPKLLAGEKERVGKCQTVNLEAYNLYLRGRWFWNNLTVERLTNAIECFKQSVEKAPDYAPAYAGLADSYSVLPFFGPFPPKEVHAKAKEAALKALEIDDALAGAHSALAGIKQSYDWDWEGSEREFKRAIELNPSYAKAHQGYAYNLLYMTRFDEALKEIKRARELDPLSLTIGSDEGLILALAGRYDQAIESLKNTIAMDPNNSFSHAALGFVYFRRLMYEEAMAELSRARNLSEGWDVTADVATAGAYAVMGQRDEAEELLGRLLERSKQIYIPSCYLAVIHFLLGETDRGFEWFDRAYEERDHWLCFLKADPIYGMVGISADPRYLALLKKIGLDK